MSTATDDMSTMFATPYASPKSTTSSESSFDSADSNEASGTTTTTTTASPLPTTLDANENTTTTSPSSLKRKRRTSALTPPLSTTPDTSDHTSDAHTLTQALHVLATEAAALAHITHLYTTSPTAQSALLAAVHLLVRAHHRGAKAIICGVGKSGLVGRKTVATMKSLGLGASFLHAGEAVHGDVGDVREGDVVVFVSFSGRTRELVGVAGLLGRGVPVVVVTGAAEGEECALVEGREGAVVLPAGVGARGEEEAFGVGAPTCSTAVAMAVGDMLALTVAERVYGKGMAGVFKRNHPGGAIGERTAAEEEVEVTTVVTKKKKVGLEF